MPYRKHVSALLVNDLNLHAYLQEIALFDRRSERLLHERGVLGKAVWLSHRHRKNHDISIPSRSA
jgi:hypothetical protein